jgi:hypothetical protein
VELTVKASNATMVMVSNDGVFDTEGWQTFAQNQATETRETGPDGRLIETMVIPWTVSDGAGEKTVYAQFRSSDGATSTVVSTTVLLDPTCEEVSGEEPEESDPDAEAGAEDPNAVIGCDLIPRERRVGEKLLPQSTFGIGYDAPLSDVLGVSPITGETEQISTIYPGDLFRSYSFTTVYCLHEDQTRHPFMDETSFFTHQRTFQNIKWVTDATLSSYQVETPVLPRPTVVLGKFESDPRVYRIDSDPSNASTLILRHIDDESIAIDSYGDRWADYVIDLNPTLVNAFEYGTPLMEPEIVDTSAFRKRELLNENSASLESENEDLFTIVAQFFSRAHEEIRQKAMIVWLKLFRGN